MDPITLYPLDTMSSLILWNILPAQNLYVVNNTVFFPSIAGNFETKSTQGFPGFW